MEKIQQLIAQLQQRGWTIAAISDALGVSWESVSRWRSGRVRPESPRLVIFGLTELLRRRRIPKRKRYTSKRPPPQE